MQVQSNPLNTKVTQVIEKATKRLVVSALTLAGGLTFDTKLVVLSDGTQIVAKLPKQKDIHLSIEGATADYLINNSELPVPKVFLADDEILIHEYVIADGVLTVSSEPEAASILVKLHENTSPTYGFDFDTLYQGIMQPNKREKKWTKFFAEQRLLFMANIALKANMLPKEEMKRIEKLASVITKYIDEPKKPSLIHGDISASTVLCQFGKVKAFVDSACCYADNEFEFAMSPEQAGLTKRFYSSYNELHLLSGNFYEVCQPIYSLYPLLADLSKGNTDNLTNIKTILDRFVG